MSTAAECRCDPPGSGEEFCTGHCVLIARIAELERLVATVEAERDEYRGEVTELEITRAGLEIDNANLQSVLACDKHKQGMTYQEFDAAGGTKCSMCLVAKPHLEDVMRDIAEWGRRTFPQSTWRAAALHLIEEAVEVLMADPDRPTVTESEADRLAEDLLRVVEGTVLRSLARPSERPAEELADAQLLLSQLFYRHACADPLLEVQRKFEIVQQRAYGPPEPNGVVHRVGWAEATR